MFLYTFSFGFDLLIILFVLPVLVNNIVYSACLVLFQVWDNMIIESALKKFYGSDLSTMIQAIQRNISVISSLYLYAFIQMMGIPGIDKLMFFLLAIALISLLGLALHTCI